MYYVNNERPLVILTGPTAVGKTDLSIRLAEKLNAEIISADSIQIYKYMDIGSAKITESEMQGVKHYLIDELDPKDEFNIFRFKKMALECMEQIYAKGKVPLIVGGTGFYIQSVLYDIDFNETDDNHGYRNELQKLCDEKGPEYLHKMLADVDSESAEKIHFNNVKRVIRALEFYKESGQKLSEHNDEQHEKESPYNFKYFVLDDERDILYDRINKRVDIMFENGLVSEVKKLLDMGYSKNLVSMQGIGYKETIDYIENNAELDEVKERIKLDTRHFAKRQLTWFRREKTVDWIRYPDFANDKDKMLEEMVRQCKESSII